MLGAHRPYNALSGNKHPNYRHGNATKPVRREHSIAIARIHALEEIGLWFGSLLAHDLLGVNQSHAPGLTLNR